MTALLVAIGAALGGPLRYLADRTLQDRYDSIFPVGTFAVNVVGSAVLGFVAAASGSMDESLNAGITTGFCGALTTYSTFGYETLRLVESGARLIAVLNVVGNITAGVSAATLGWLIGSAIW